MILPAVTSLSKAEFSAYEVPVSIKASSIGLKAKDIKRAEKLIQENRDLIEEKWNEYDRRRKNP